MKKPDNIPEITTEEIDSLVKRIRSQSLSKEDMDMIERLLRTILFLVNLLQGKNITIKRLKRMLFGEKTEKHKPENKHSDQTKESNDFTEFAGDDVKETNAISDNIVVKARGHGRRRAEAYKVTQVIQVKHEQYKKGENCPIEWCKGRLYEDKPSILIKLEGHPPVTAIRYEQEVLRCALCGERFRASLPEGVSTQRHTASSDAAIAVNKYGGGQPLYRQARMQESYGVPLSESVQWDRIKQTASAGGPIHKQLRQICGNGEVICGDDTGVVILSRKASKNREPSEMKSKSERKSTYTTVLIGKTFDGHKIALYISGAKHAGENLSELIEMREDQLPQLIQMCDALSANTKGVNNTIVCLCLAHARRRFYDLKDYYPQECNLVLDLIGKAYEIESQTKAMSKQERLKHHQIHSKPIMDELKKWLDEQVEKNRVEPNSILGSAIAYMRKHWSGLTKWLSVAGAPIDNNLAERGVKRFVLFRKNSLFYKNDNGAEAGNVLHSLIETCRLNGEDPMEYLQYVVNNSEEIKKSPDKHLPWNYRQNYVQALVA